MKYLYKKLISCAFFGLTIGLNAQTTTENYIKTIECLDATCTEKKETVVYFDGLGREKQMLQVGASPTGKTIAVPIEYDGFGRQAKDYLPIPLSSNTNAFSSNSGIIETGSSFYSGEPAYSEKTFEDSPLNRVLAQSAPGNTWKKGGGHEIQFQYETNSTGEVKRYDVVGDNVAQNEFYSPGSLYKIVTTDENGQPIQEFKDKEGRIVLKRIHTPSTDANNSSGNHDTFYIYDIYGNLRFVIPPLLADLAITPANLDELGYQYIYDDKNRLIEKKLPGKGWEYMVYDKQDRLVGLQDELMRNEDKWLFTKYDKFGRVALTGFEWSNGNRIDIQNYINTLGSNNVSRDINGYDHDNIKIYYNTAGYGANNHVLTINYYDNYVPSALPNSSTNIASGNSLKGALTSTIVREIGVWNFMNTTTYYDSRYLRPFEVNQSNFLGGYTKTISDLDFRGKVKKTTTKHKRDNRATELTLVDEFEYYPNELLKYQTHQINGGIKEYITQNSYNEINQLITKGVGNSNQSTPLQMVDYKYNIRGWLTDINDVNNLGTGTYRDLFSFQLNYDKITRLNWDERFKPLYNGNISEVLWKGNDNTLRSYSYNYDKLNRFLEAVYIKGPNTVVNAYNEIIKGYDKNGNIKGIVRAGEQDVSNQLIFIDDLNYTYQANSNKLLAVTDNPGYATKGFIDGNTTGNDYAYDVNGNLIQDLNKEITKISYNHLNLPTEVLWSSTKKINYSYDASGVKLRKTITDGTKITTTDYLGGFQYKDDVLQFFPTAEGYVNVTNGTAFNYVYNYTDHLGNIRVSYQKESNGNLKVLEENNYYPFGLKHEGYNNTNLANQNYKYKYNGKELQTDLDINLYDYGARNYDPAIGRWFNIDPLADERTWISSYNYVQNNPISRVDPTGMLDGWIDYENEGQRTIQYRSDINTKKEAEEAGFKNVNQVIESGSLTSSNGTVYNLSSNGGVSTDYFFGSFSYNTTRDIYTSGGSTIKGFLNGYKGDGSITAPYSSYFSRWDHQVAMGLWQGGADAAIGGAVGKGLGLFKAGIKEVQTTTALAEFWPKNGGALGKWETTYLMPGTQIDRYGSGFGKYLSPIDTPMPMRALPPGNTGAYNAYQVIKPFPVQSSTIAPAFGQPGLGTQYLSPVNVNTLLKRGIIAPIN